MHGRYRVEHDFLDARTGDEVMTISRTVNAFFRWEFNSCEVLIKDGQVHPIDYANACPDVAVTSLHYYFPWAISALVKWTVFCLVTDRRPDIDLDTRAYFDVADRAELSYADKIAAYRRLADSYLQVDAYQDFCARYLSTLDERVLDWIKGPEFDQLLLDTVTATYPPHEQEQFLAHFRGLIDMWVDERHER
jgi:hypothetical protein